MSPTLWAPYGDALKLILTGTTTETLTADQKAIFSEMLSRGIRDDSGNKLEKRRLPETVRTQEYCVDEKNRKSETYYYIPDLVLYMCDVFPDWSIMNPPVNLDYLNSLRDEAGNHVFLYSNAPGHKDWENSKDGQRHWGLVCRRLEILKEIDELKLTNHQNDALKLEAQKRMRKELKHELKRTKKKLDDFEVLNGKKAKDYTKSTVDSNTNNWKSKGREIGNKVQQQFPHLSVEQISEKVHQEMTEKDITGRGGKVITTSETVN